MIFLSRSKKRFRRVGGSGIEIGSKTITPSNPNYLDLAGKNLGLRIVPAPPPSAKAAGQTQNASRPSPRLPILKA